MSKAAKTYVRIVDAINRKVGMVVMFFVFIMIAIMVYEAVSRTVFHHPNIWSVEMTEFVMAAYYMLGGGFTLLIGGHVRMDLFYHRWPVKKKAAFDVGTFVIIFFYIIILMIGAVQSLQYSIEFKQVTYSAWAPPVTPIKLIMLVGIMLMFLQVISEFIKDIAKARGEDIA